MALSMYQASVPIFVKTLGDLSNILDKGAAYAAAKKVDQSVLLGYRIAPDMLAFVRQVQIACDFAKGATARFAGNAVPAWEDTEKSIDDLKARIIASAVLVCARDIGSACALRASVVVGH
jgi:uncharacterized protein